MNSKKLEEVITKINQLNIRDELTVVIPIEESAVGQTAHVTVSALTKGFDWNRNLLFVNPDKPLQYANRHEMYRNDLDRLEKYKENPNMYKHYTQDHNRMVKRAETLISKTEISKLTSQQLKDLIKLLVFNG